MLGAHRSLDPRGLRHAAARLRRARLPAHRPHAHHLHLRPHVARGRGQRRLALRLGMLLAQPALVLVGVAHPFLPRMRASKDLSAAIDGLNAAAVGSLAYADAAASTEDD